MRAASRIAVALLCAASASAQIRVELPHSRDPSAPRGVFAEVTPVSASVRPAGMGHVRIDLENRDSALHTVVVDLRDPYSGAFSTSVTVEVDGGGRARAFLPFPSVEYGAQLRLRSDGGESVYAASIERPGQGIGVSALLVTTSPGADAVGFESMLQRLLLTQTTARTSTPYGDARVLAELQELRSADLPPTWTGIAGFDLVIVDGRRGALDDRAQRVVRDYLRAGGRVLALAVDAMPEGVLRAALEGSAAGRGFGLALRLDADEAAGLPGDPGAVAGLVDWLSLDDGFLLAGARPTSGPLPPESFRPLNIPGLGDAPLRVFFLLILCFAVVVGPLNYFYWKRRRQLPMLLVTVPGLGLLTTAVLLGYGFLSEGLGIQSAERSLTILDQERREAVSWDTRTLFAGLSPDVIRPRSGTLVTCLDAQTARYGRTSHVLRIFADGLIDGALLPSRTPTTLAVVAQGPERARLRFERGGDGSLVALSGPELEPLPGARYLLLRTPDGVFWLSGEDGRLRPCTGKDAAGARNELLQRFLDGVEAMPDWRWAPRLALDVSWPNEGPVARFVRAMDSVDGGALPAGHYLALVQDSPSVDHLELRGEESGVHLVIGRLGPEDLVD